MVDRRGWLLAVALLALCSVWVAPPALAQGTGGSGGDVGLLPMIPAEAVFFVERRGHEAVKEVFDASNLGKMAADDAINQFVHDTRVKIGKLMVTEMLNLKRDDTAEIDRHQKLLHEVLKAVWYRPSAMFALYGDVFDGPPGIGVLCLAGDYRKPAAEAMAALMASLQAGGPQWHAFTYRSGTLTWQGALKGDPKTAPPTDNVQLRKALLETRDVFMFTCHGQLLCAATHVRAADAIAATVASPGKGKDADPAVRGVLGKTAIRDWAFRWHVDIAGIFAKAQKSAGVNTELPSIIRMLAIDKIRGAGGSGGYADNVYTRRTYIDAPQDKGGLTRLFKLGGSYKPALAMTPGEHVFAAGGQLDTKVLLGWLRLWASKSASKSATVEIEVTEAEGTSAPGRAEIVVVGPAPGRAEIVVVRPGPGTPPTAPAPDAKDAKLTKLTKLLEDFVGAAGGDATVYVTDLQSFFLGMSGEGGLPVGAVLSVKQVDKARKALDDLLDEIEAGIADDKAADDKTDTPKPPKVYRKIPIRVVADGSPLLVAWLPDRVVLALGDGALKAGIDVALDDIGGLEPNSPAAKLLELAGDGAGFFTMDLAGIARLLWPVLSQAAEQPGMGLPLASLPSTEKMVRMLGKEVAVIQPDADGLLLSSRGKIPFATKVMFLALGILH